jgi:hypothetical protein
MSTGVAAKMPVRKVKSATKSAGTRKIPKNPMYNRVEVESSIAPLPVADEPPVDKEAYPQPLP